MTVPISTPFLPVTTSLIPTNSLVKRNPWSLKAPTTPSHPQLRDLLVCSPEDPDAVSVVYWDSIVRHDLYNQRSPQRTQLRFAPSTMAGGCGLIACGGQNAELAVRSANPSSTWVYQRVNGSGSINNSVNISPAPLSSSTPRLLVSNNDESIKVYDVAGRAPDFARARRTRERVRMRHDEEGDEMDVEGAGEVEEQGVWDAGEKCTLEKVEWAEIKLRTAINHSSVSPDGKKLVAVGDTNEVFLFDVANNGGYELVHVFQASDDASFSSDWNGSSDKFAIASQDGYVNVYDIRNLPSDASRPYTVATFHTSQKGPSGAARKVKFSPSGVSSDLMAFTEHRSKVHIIDARTFERIQVVDVPSSPVTYNHRPLSLRPRSHRATHPRSPSSSFPISSEVQEVLDDVRQREGGDVYGTSTGFARLLERAAATEGSVNGAMDRVIERELQRERERARERRWNLNYQVMPLRDGRAPSGSGSGSGGGGGAEGGESEGSRVTVAERLAMLRRSAASVSEAREAAGGDLIEDEDEDEEEDEEEEEEDDDNDEERRRRDRDEEEEEDEDDIDEDDEEEDDDCPEPGPFSPSSRPITGSPLNPGRTPTTTILQSRHSRVSGPFTATSTSAFPSLPGLSTSNPNLSGYNAISSGYQSNSMFFPVDNQPNDLLGLDWDEWGERLFVATGTTVWEFEVDGRGRRCFGDWAVA